MSFFSPLLLRNNFTGFRIVGWWLFFFPSTLNILLLSTSLYDFWGDIGCNYYLCFSVANVFFSSGFFQDFFFIFEFFGLNIICLDVLLFGVLWASWICYLVIDINWGKFSVIIVCNILSFSFLLAFLFCIFYNFCSCPIVLGYPLIFFKSLFLFAFYFWRLLSRCSQTHILSSTMPHLLISPSKAIFISATVIFRRWPFLLALS